MQAIKFRYRKTYGVYLMTKHSEILKFFSKYLFCLRIADLPLENVYLVEIS